MLFLAIGVATGWLFMRLPGSFLPDEDRGILLSSVQMPVGATQDRTLRVLDRVKDYYLTEEKDAVDGIFYTAGFGFGGEGQNVGIGFAKLKPFDERTSPDLSAKAVAGRSEEHTSELQSLMRISYAVFCLK